MTVLATDSFVRSNQSGSFGTGSDGGTWTQRRGNQTLSIASDQGVMTYNGSTALGVMTYTSQQPSASEITFNGLATGGSDIVGGILDADSTGNNFYHTNLGNVAGHLEVGKDVAGSFTSLGTAVFSSSTNTEYSFRFQAGVTSGTLKSKVWIKGNTEPASFMITVTDSAFSSGFFGLCAAPDAVGAAEKFDTFQTTDGSSVTTNTMAATDILSLIDSVLFSDLASIADTLNAGDNFSSGGSSQWVDLLSANDSFSSGGGPQWVDLFSANDSFLTTNQTLWIETNPALDGFLGTNQTGFLDALNPFDAVALIQIFSPLDALQVSDAFLASEQTSWTETAPAFDGFLGTAQNSFIDTLNPFDMCMLIQIFNPLDVLQANDVFLVNEQTFWTNINALFDSFTWSEISPVQITILALFPTALRRTGSFPAGDRRAGSFPVAYRRLGLFPVMYRRLGLFPVAERSLGSFPVADRRGVKS